MTSNNLYIYHHLGIGDHILCNGLVRHFAELHDKVFVFAKPHYSKNVMYMFRDDPRIKIIPMEEGAVRSFIDFNKQNNYLIVGHSNEYFQDVNSGKVKFDEGFYNMAVKTFTLINI